MNTDVKPKRSSQRRYSPELKERAVRMAQQPHQAGQTRRVRVPPLHPLPDPITPLRRQTLTGTYSPPSHAAETRRAMQLCFAANDLLAWSNGSAAPDSSDERHPRPSATALLHVAARITPTGRGLRLDRRWPWTTTLLDAITRVRAAFASLSLTNTTAAPAAYE